MESKSIVAQDGEPINTTGILHHLASESFFWQARYLVGSAALDLLPFLFWVVENSRPRLLVSLEREGSEAYFAMCQTADQLSLETRCFNIGSVVASDDIRHHNTENYEHFSTFLNEETNRATDRFVDHSVDLLYVDLAQTTGNLDGWGAKLSPHSVLVMRGVSDPDLHATQAFCLEQLGLKHLDFSLNQSSGIGLGLGPKAAERLKQLARMGLGVPGYSAVQKTFHHLGKAQANIFHIQAGRSALHAQKEDLARLRKDAETAFEMRDSLQQGYAVLRRAYEARNQQIAVLDAQHYDKIVPLKEALEESANRQSALSAALQRKNDELADHLQKSDALREEHKSKITWLRTEVDKTRAEAGELTEQVRTLKEQESKIDWLRRELEKARTGLGELEATRASKDVLKAELGALGQQLETRTDELVALTRLFEETDNRMQTTRHDEQDRQAVRIELRDAEIAILRSAGSRLRRGDAHTRAGLPPLKKQLEVIRASRLFDAEWYLKTHPDVAEQGMDPARHYVQHGALDGRDPGPEFSTMAYYLANRDVAQRGFNALVHYEMFGRDENRKLGQAG